MRTYRQNTCTYREAALVHTLSDNTYMYLHNERWVRKREREKEEKKKKKEKGGEGAGGGRDGEGEGEKGGEGVSIYKCVSVQSV